MILRIAALLASLSVPLAAAPQDAVIAFKARASIDRVDIRLGDVAEVRTSNQALRQRLETLRVGRVSRSHYRRTIRRDDVLSQIARTRGAPQVVGQGAVQTIVELHRDRYPASALVATAREHLSRRLRARYPTLTRLVVEPVGEVPELRLPAGDIAVSPRPIHDQTLSRRVCVWMDVALNGKPYRSVPVWLRVEAVAPVLVAKRPFKPREELAPGGFVLEERDIAGLRDTAVADIAAVVGQRARTYIPAGTIVQPGLFEPSPSVLAHAMVNVRVVSGSVVIETQAIAEQDGYIGDLVELRNPKTSAVFTARVVGDNAVAITRR